MNNTTIEQRQTFSESSRARTSVPQLPDMYIQLPKPQPSRKIISSSTQQSGESQYKSSFPQEDTLRFQSQFSNSQQGSGLLVNQSSFSRHNQGSKSDKQIILDWVKNIMQRRELLGFHWQEGLSKKRHELVQWAFFQIKSNFRMPNSQLNSESRHPKPIKRRQNHLIFQGLEKASNILGSQLYSIKHRAFGKIRRSGISFITTPHSHLTQHFSANGKQSVFVWQNYEGNDRVRLLSPSVYRREDSEAVKLQKMKSAQHLNYIANQYALSPIPLISLNPESRRRKKNNQSQPPCIFLAKSIQINHTTNNNYTEVKTENKDTSRQKQAHEHFQKQYLPVKMQEIRKSTSKFMPNKHEQTRPLSHQNMQLRPHQVSQLRLPQQLNTIKQSQIRSRPASASPNVSIKISYMGQQTKCVTPTRSNECLNQYYVQSKKTQQTGLISPKGIVRNGSQSGTSSPSARYGFDRPSGLPTPASTPMSTPHIKSPQRKSIQQSAYPSTSRV